MQSTAVRMNSLPNMLRKGDLVEDILPDGRLRNYTLTEHPKPGVIVYDGHLVPVTYLIGRDDYAGHKVITVKCSRLPLGSSRELRLDGRPAPVFYRPPEPTLLY